MINGTPVDIAIGDNVTSGMSYIANGITLKAGDEIVTTDPEQRTLRSTVQAGRRHR